MHCPLLRTISIPGSNFVSSVKENPGHMDVDAHTSPWYGLTDVGSDQDAFTQDYINSDAWHMATNYITLVQWIHAFVSENIKRYTSC